MPAPRRNKQSKPASAPYPSRPPLQAPPPPANPNSKLLTPELVQFIANSPLFELSSISGDSHENRAIINAIRHRDLSPTEAIANAEASMKAKVRRRLNYRHTAKMAQATDLPIELIDLILSFLPPNHAEQVEWRRRAAGIGREDRLEGWNLSDHRCRRCGRICLAMWGYEEQKAWVIQRWGYWGPRQWAIAGFFVLCPCNAMLGNYFGRYWFV
ncbi:hypothetical protein AGABI1DRAFT_93371 [Agaricus bisporus var. burnettii JB137-S8]|uniref:F-box domain-containing protein n=1 Tax=Agaricus bisporus var. burnettii (strain JB137-S8 / ATCC MYA-4627 / FGSC 10392) TaxID=597362 RepID=K5X3D2_AGABU|nr:uncharacterized protein AGABI1DRAFT_93371 [Agaricus bisporus var. burnettii JB137-S8]EKM77668.1 hypothetical protein AGABI1DRAFT_93371 [Agaricus bisporus var. burnettii JB137-S8]